jgi:hypothetical protein
MALTGNLAQGVSTIQVPLARIAAAVRGYASYLRTAQEKASAYAYAAQAAQVSRHPVDIAAAEAARQDAASAIAAQQAAGDHAAAQVRDATGQMDNPFGPDGQVRNWIEKIHAPWDTLAGDAAVTRALAIAGQGEEAVKEAKEFSKALPALFRRNAQLMNTELEAVDADPMAQANEILRLLTDTEKMAKWNTGLEDAGEALTKGAVFWKSIAAGSDVLGGIGDGYTIYKPEDSGAIGWADRGVASVNLGLSTADLLGVVGVTQEVPVLGQAVLIGTGLYLGGDYLYHHWTPFRNVCNDIGHATVAEADDIAHAATSTAKDAWHGITSLF